jgi:hypothetical protein
MLLTMVRYMKHREDMRIKAEAEAARKHRRR